MEGTRNERSIIIITSYVIGFVSAFILYSFSEQNVETNTVILTTATIQEPTITQTENITKSEIENSGQFALNSKDNKDVFFCRDEVTPTDYCTAYIFSDESDSVTQVLLDNQPVTMYKDLLAEVSWSDEGLIIGNIKSVNQQSPWLLVDQNSPIDLQ